MNPHSVFDKITVIAPGLLGASICKAARKRSLARQIAVWARRTEAREALLQQDWVDSAPTEIEESCSGSDLVILCAPVKRIIEIAERIAPHLDSNPIVTDVGSVKSALSRACAAALEGKARFVGSHPMAGSEKTGMENAAADLFENRACFVTPFPNADADALKSVSDFWGALGSSVIEKSPEEHDAIVANVSHLPHLIASAIATHLAHSYPDSNRYCGNGLRDTTRIAAGDPTLWREIISQNRDEILRALASFEDELHALRSSIANEDEFEILKRLADGKSFREGLDA